MSEILYGKSDRRSKRVSARSYPEQATISQVVGSEFSETGILYKAVVRYLRHDGTHTTETKRFPTVKQAREWAKRTLAKQKGRNGW
jgi:hypothetical protein